MIDEKDVTFTTTKRPDLKTEAGVIAWILKNNMDVKTIRKSLKDIQKSSELV